MKRKTSSSQKRLTPAQLWDTVKTFPHPASLWMGRKIEHSLVPDNILVFPHHRAANSRNMGDYHPRYVLDIVTGSPGTVRIGDAHYRLKEGDALLIFPHPFNRTPNEEADRAGRGWLIITFDLREATPLLSLRNSPRRIRSHELKILQQILHTYQHNGSPLELSRLLSQLLLSLTTAPGIPTSQQNVPMEETLRDDLLEKVNQHLFDNLSTALPLSILAHSMGYSESRLRELFRQQVGISLGAYIRRQRLYEAARRLTLGNSNITEIASQLGFSSVQTFSHTFKTVYGLSPKQYEKMVRENTG